MPPHGSAKNFLMQTVPPQRRFELSKRESAEIPCTQTSGRRSFACSGLEVACHSRFPCESASSTGCAALKEKSLISQSSSIARAHPTASLRLMPAATFMAQPVRAERSCSAPSGRSHRSSGIQCADRQRSAREFSHGESDPTPKRDSQPEFAACICGAGDSTCLCAVGRVW